MQTQPLVKGQDGSFLNILSSPSEQTSTQSLVLTATDIIAAETRIILKEDCPAVFILPGPISEPKECIFCATRTPETWQTLNKKLSLSICPACTYNSFFLYTKAGLFTIHLSHDIIEMEEDRKYHKCIGFKILEDCS